MKVVTSLEGLTTGDVVVKFGADSWCSPCRALQPVLDELEKEHESVTFAKVDVDDSPDLAMEFGIMSIPTLIRFVDGKPVAIKSGAKTKKEVEDFIL